MGHLGRVDRTLGSGIERRIWHLVFARDSLPIRQLVNLGLLYGRTFMLVALLSTRFEQGATARISAHNPNPHVGLIETRESPSTRTVRDALAPIAEAAQEVASMNRSG